MANLDDILKLLARRILSLDEDELVRLIPKYRKLMDNFTPTQEWEESVIIYFIINGYRVKSAQFSEELKNYMNRKRLDNDWSAKIRPNIRRVLTELTESSRAGKIISAPLEESAPERPTLRLVSPPEPESPKTESSQLEPKKIDPQKIAPLPVDPKKET
ncbi:MAG: hypothetical protein LBT86_00665 [Deltaproteobacteria bacterium]|jgi:hypothetical protein|nr:hypothetical protein [Deltaproteobacteria bacterium]